MPNKQVAVPDNTAVRTALWRALHIEVDSPPHVFEDEIGLTLVAPDDGWRSRPDMSPFTRPFRASILARARFVEDLVAEQAARGVGQYVILGAGLDTFAQRRPKPGLIHHSDQGILYSRGSYLELLKRFGMLRSMSGKGNCYDNAVAESFFSSLKNEIIHHRDYQTREQARTEIFDYIELFYNRNRLHQSLNYQTPMQYELTSVCA